MLGNLMHSRKKDILEKTLKPFPSQWSGRGPIFTEAFIDVILQSTAPIIKTVRSKIDYSLDSDQNGETKVVKHGTKEITRKGFE